VDGKSYRPSIFLTLTCDSYGKVGEDGTPVDPASYDYQRAARDAIHFPALFARLIQNLRRFLGYDVQYFAAIEPQRRLAPHAHIAFRGAISRTDLRHVIAATYHQVWWPSTETVRYEGEQHANNPNPDDGFGVSSMSCDTTRSGRRESNPHDQLGSSGERALADHAGRNYWSALSVDRK